MKSVLCCVWFSVLGFALALPLAGCQEDNESGVDTGQVGTGDPKYTTSDDSGYRAFRKDHQKPAEKPAEEQKGKTKAQPK
jgi:hypothetical protein